MSIDKYVACADEELLQAFKLKKIKEQGSPDEMSGLIEMLAYFNGQKCGYVTWSWSADLYIWKAFFPLQEGTPKKKRLGTLAHCAALEILADNFITSSDHITQERIKQLNAMGIEHKKIYSVGQYKELSFAYAASKGISRELIKAALTHR